MIEGKAKRIILPGVGSFDFGMFQLKQYGLDALLTDLVLNKKVPILGVCLGMQLMLSKSEEGVSKGLGWINGESKSFLFDKNLCRPHMGWNNLSFDQPHPLLRNVPDGSHAYFVHSYHMELNAPSQRIACVDYGQPISAIVGRDTMVGTQFHPEKSSIAGLQMIANFLSWSP